MNTLEKRRILEYDVAWRDPGNRMHVFQTFVSDKGKQD